MFRCASWGPIGVKPESFEAGLDLAAKVGFEGHDVPIGPAADYVERQQAEAFVELYRSRGLRLGPWGFPVDWKGEEESWRAGLKQLPRLAAAGQKVGATRSATWVPSWSETRAHDENFAWHIERFQPAAAILADHGCSLGLEFIGPKTLRADKPHEFISDLPGMLELCAAIGPNVGLLLDCWHWYTSGGDAAQLEGLAAEQVVNVHVNDAPPGIDRDEQIDSVRLLPAASGVIDIATFLRQLERMGYDGPVIVEPFNQELREMDDEAAARRTKESLDRSWAQAGLS